jgi:hypothetical protein
MFYCNYGLVFIINLNLRGCRSDVDSVGRGRPLLPFAPFIVVDERQVRANAACDCALLGALIEYSFIVGY